MFRSMLALSVVSLLATSLYAEETIRVACLGDSITEGPGLKSPWPEQLQALLGKGYEVRNFGVGAATLLFNGDKPYAKQPEYEAAVKFAPHITIVMLGTNDSKANNAGAIKAIAKDLPALFKPFQDRRAQILCCTPPVVNQGHWGIDPKQLRVAVAPAIRSASKAAKVTLIDVHKAFEGDDRNLWSDGVHLNQTGSTLVAETVLSAIKEVKSSKAKK